MKKILFLCVVGLVIISATACDTSKKNTDKNLIAELFIFIVLKFLGQSSEVI